MNADAVQRGQLIHEVSNKVKSSLLTPAVRTEILLSSPIPEVHVTGAGRELGSQVEIH